MDHTDDFTALEAQFQRLHDEFKALPERVVALALSMNAEDQALLAELIHQRDAEKANPAPETVALYDWIDQEPVQSLNIRVTVLEGLVLQLLSTVTKQQATIAVLAGAEVDPIYGADADEVLEAAKSRSTKPDPSSIEPWDADWDRGDEDD